MKISIKNILLRLANYNCFTLEYYPLLHNTFIGVGIFLIFQILLIFCSTLLITTISLSKYFIVGFGFSTLFSIIYFIWIKFSTKLLHNNILLKPILILHFIVSTLIILFTTLTFCLYIFDEQIIFQQFLSYGIINFELNNLYFFKAKLFFKLIFESDYNYIIASCFTALYILQLFIFSYPFYLIFSNKNSLYTLSKTIYEQKFKIL